MLGSFGGGGGGGTMTIPPPPGPPVSAALIVDDPSSMLSASQETKAQEKATIATAKSIFFILFRIKNFRNKHCLSKNFEGFRQACCLDVRPVLGSTARPSEEKNYTSRITSASENHAVLKSVLYICSRCIKIRQLISEGKVTAGFPRHC